MSHIVKIQLQSLSERLKDRDITLSWSETLVEHLGNTGYDPSFGARPLKRLIQKELINMLSRKILENEIPNHTTVHLDFKENAITTEIKPTASLPLQ